ncbi:MAG TPA: NAD(P)-dependent alcohol dehydrogenase [Candidatus Dormibacteraeota bacterium]
MKAIVCDRRDNFKLEEIEEPAVPDDGVLVRVHASSVNPVDLFPLSGAGRLMRRINRKPRRDVLGTDFAGTVESVGKDVSRFRPGDEVFGGEHGSFAEYVCLSETGGLAHKPANITFEEAGTVAVAGLTALQAVRDHGRVRPGHKVLINGASGGVGTFAVQIASGFGAEVTAVCSPRNLESARSLGAHEVIDYTREDFTKSGELYDVLIDIAGSRSLSECRHVLKPDARFVLVGAAAVQHTSEMKAFGHFIGTRLRSMRGSQTVALFIAKLTHEDMEAIAGLMADGQVTPVVDRRYRLGQLADAFAYFNEGHAMGKIAIDVTRSAQDGAGVEAQPAAVALSAEV